MSNNSGGSGIGFGGIVLAIVVALVICALL